MRRAIAALCLIGLLSLSAFAPAGEFNKKLSVGDAAPVWKDLPGVDGKMHSLADLKDKQFVVLVFTCNSCPIAVDYEDRIIGFTKKYAGKDGKVAVVAVNVNVIEEDKLPKMIERSKEKGYNFPYLFDESQKIAKDYGATYTPEFFVLDKDRKIAYLGAMDDTSAAANVKARFLEEALDALLKGEKPAKGETLARGCLIRWSRAKK
jgi:peroxiredoxin